MQTAAAPTQNENRTDPDAKAVRALRLAVKAMGERGYTEDAVHELVATYAQRYNLEKRPA